MQKVLNLTQGASRHYCTKIYTPIFNIMKSFVLLLAFVFCWTQKTISQNTFDLKPNQSMLMTGKGPGQDGSLNPFAGENCYAIVENLGETEFSIRVQRKGEILKTIPIKGGEIKKVVLLKGNEMYFDTEPKTPANAKITYEKMEV